jgi:hypothetical protein
MVTGSILHQFYQFGPKRVEVTGGDWRKLRKEELFYDVRLLMLAGKWEKLL